MQDSKSKNTSPTKTNNRKQQHTQKKSLKLTLPKPVMHATQNTQNGEEKIYAEKFYIDNKEAAFTDRYSTDIKYDTNPKYVNDVKYVNTDVKYVSDIKYVNSMPETKYVIEKEVPERIYQNYQAYQDNGYADRHEKKNLKVKM